MRSWFSARNGLIAAAIAFTVAGCGGGWWFLGGDDPETTIEQIVTGPAAAASAPATKPAPTPPPAGPTEHPTSSTEEDKPAPTAVTTNHLLCNSESWRAGVGKLKGMELASRVGGMDAIPARVTDIFVGGAVTCVDGKVYLSGKPLSSTELAAGTGFLDALGDSASKTVVLVDGRKVDIGNPDYAGFENGRAHAPDKLATK